MSSIDNNNNNNISDHTILLRSNSSNSDKDIEGQFSAKSSSGRSNKSIKDIWNRLDRAFSGKRLSIKHRSPRVVTRWPERDRVSPRRVVGGDGDDEVLGDGAPPEWALLLLGCLLGLATGLCVAAFNRGVSFIDLMLMSF